MLTLYAITIKVGQLKKQKGVYLALILLVVLGCKKEAPKDLREKFLGEYNGRELSCTVSSPGFYSIVITPLQNESEVNISNIWDAQDNTVGVVKADGNLYIANQPFDEGKGTITGRATMISGTLSIGYSITHTQLGSSTDNCVWLNY